MPYRDGILPGAADSAPLAGLRVIDMTTSYAGPTAAMYLADLGADVVKVERPGAGDDCRSWGPPFVEGASAWFASANRNKRSVVLDVRSERGREVLHALIADADVFIQNLNPAKLDHIGVDPATMTARFPRLIYCAMSGFGLTGPDYALPGYDLAAQARSGLMSVTGAKGGTPQRVSSALSDIATGMCAALAISAASVRQQRTGHGDVIDVSLLDSDLALMAPRIAAYVAGEPEPVPSGGTDSVLAVYQPFPTADRDIVVAIGNDAMWRRFCFALGLDHLAHDVRLLENVGRREHREHIAELIAERLRERSAEEWMGILGEAAVPCSLIRSLSEVLEDPQVRARGAVMPVPGRDDLVSVHSPFRLGSIAEPHNRAFPELGAHTREVLAEVGLTPDEIEDLIASGAACDEASPSVSVHA